jgi:hypothetical protein
VTTDSDPVVTAMLALLVQSHVVLASTGDEIARSSRIVLYRSSVAL